MPSRHLRTGYLSDVGWYRSVAEQRIVDAAGEPIPWLTYPAIQLLNTNLPRENLRVFEYGAGASTFWWSARASSVLSVEHDRDWHSSVSSSLPSNVTLLLIPLSEPEAYDRAVLQGDGPYDVVVIDGRRRVECSLHVPARLSSRGIVVWDNSDRPRYARGLAEFERLGFRRLDLHGMAPRDTISAVTAILYRDQNLLGL